MTRLTVILAGFILAAAGCQSTFRTYPIQRSETKAAAPSAPAAVETQPAADDSADIYITRLDDEFTKDVEGTPETAPPHVDLFKPGETPAIFLKNLGGRTVLITLEKIGDASPLISSREVYIPAPWNRRTYNWGKLKNGSYNVTISTRDNFTQSVGFYVGDETDTTKLPLTTSPSAGATFNTTMTPEH